MRYGTYSRITRLISFATFLGVLGLGGCGETIDDYDSETTCQGYCAKQYDCDDYTPSTTETDACVASCRNAIEDKCGNDDQAAANELINACVDKSCDEFDTCMGDTSQPECFDFAD